MKAIWTTVTGAKVEVDLRGHADDGRAVIWTGRMQVSVPADAVKAVEDA